MTNKPTHEKPIALPAATIRRLWRGFACALTLTVFTQFFITPKPYFTIDGQFWFYPVLGLLASIAMVLMAKLLGYFLKRPEDYWKHTEGDK